MNETAQASGPGSWIEVDGKARRRILAYTSDMMVVEVEFRDGGFGAMHSHPHVQSTYVRSGRFEFEIDGTKYEVGTGDSLIMPSNVVHGCRVIEAGTLIDVFTPARQDFLNA
ncbi:cupin domain-containing protein [Consotaella salsifontis]|uniref:Cupin domain protein n=1 Tax=Consotaella salsifontis TaxID=1365950 RepID=A0A1T4MJ32_9HYPH|nr:cupin domain-containing protein [Consotaella salsifontis]SJZ66846.1 Cupin domain protein [Consotaella salsifontis]